MVKIKFINLLVFCLFWSNSFAQKVSNTQTRQIGNTIQVSYTLEAKKTSSVSLYISQDGANTWQGPLKKVSGDEGIEISPGNNMIVWNVLEEVNELVGDRIQFQVRVDNNIAIGLAYRGGVVAYILKPGDIGYDPYVLHGLIAAPSDQEKKLKYGCYQKNIRGAQGTKISTGNNNTRDVKNGCFDSKTAAKTLYKLKLNGYDDWYLPSKDELNQLFLNKDAIGGFVGINDYNNGLDFFYLSSSEKNNNTSWCQDFMSGAQYDFSKKKVYRVRAVRSF